MFSPVLLIQLNHYLHEIPENFKPVNDFLSTECVKDCLYGKQNYAPLHREAKLPDCPIGWLPCAQKWMFII